MEFPDGNPGPPRGVDRSLWTGWPRSMLLALVLLLIVSNFAVQYLAYGMGAGDFGSVIAGGLVGVIFPLWLIGARRGPAFLADLGLDRPRPAVLALSSVMALAAIYPTSLLAELSLRIFPPTEAWVLLANESLPQSSNEIVVAAATALLVAPLVEEIIFRGLLQRLVATYLGEGQGMIYAAAVFGVIHMQLWSLFGLIGVGLVLGFIFRATRSVTACILAHALHNAVSLSVMVGTGPSTYEPNSVTGSQAWITGISLAVLLVAGADLWRERDRTT